MLSEFGIEQITIPLPFRLNHVNCFIADGSNGKTVLDTGLHSEVTKNIWAPIAAKNDIKNIVITHYHPDHFGYAGSLQKLTGADVWMTKTDAEVGLTYWESSSLKRKRQDYFTCGLPRELMDQLMTDEESFTARVEPYPVVQHEVVEGMKIMFGKLEFEVMFTPGHSDGLFVLYNKENSILFSTDHILPKVSPNISYRFRGNPNPLQSFITSLEKIKKLNAQYVFPSHFKPFKNANSRIDELIDHHEERLEFTYHIVKQPATVYEVTISLFQHLNLHQMRFAIGEALAHLEYLVANNQCRKYLSDDGTWHYEAV